MTNLTATQISEVRAPSVKFSKDAYESVVAGFRKAKSNGIGNLEAEFVGVKPQHVAFMLKRTIGDDETLTVTIHAAYGVCLLKNAPAKPAAAEKATPKKRTTRKAA